MKNWINPSQLSGAFPKNAEELFKLRPDIEAIEGELLPYDFWEWAPERANDFGVFYLDSDEPVAIVLVEPFKRTAHLHGIRRRGFEGRGIEYYIVKFTLEYIYTTINKHTVFITVKPGNREMLGFARRWGFKRSHESKEGILYKLHRLEYYERHLKDD